MPLVHSIVFSDVPLASSNAKGQPSGLIYELLKALDEHPSIGSVTVFCCPSILSRLYFPLQYLLKYFLYSLGGKGKRGHSDRRLFILYPSRMRPLGTILPSPVACIGPDDTHLVLSSLASTAPVFQKPLRWVELLINSFYEALTPNIQTFLVGNLDLTSFRRRHPRHRAKYLPHPLFTEDLLSGKEVKRLLMCDSPTKLSILLFGTTIYSEQMALRLKQFLVFLTSAFGGRTEIEFKVYGSTNHWMLKYLNEDSSSLAVTFSPRFASFSDLVAPFSAFLSLAPYHFGTKTRVLSSLANAIPCFCKQSDIPYNISSMAQINNHCFDPWSNLISSFNHKAFFSPFSRIELMNSIRHKCTNAKSLEILLESCV